MPGPFMTMTVGESARSGPWVGPKMIVGHAFLEIGLLIGLFFGLAPLFKNELFFVIIALAGGAIMIWMAQGMFRSLPKLEIKTTTQNTRQTNLYLAGVLMSLATPTGSFGGQRSDWVMYCIHKNWALPELPSFLLDIFWAIWSGIQRFLLPLGKDENFLGIQLTGF